MKIIYVHKLIQSNVTVFIYIYRVHITDVVIRWLLSDISV